MESKIVNFLTTEELYHPGLGNDRGRIGLLPNFPKKMIPGEEAAFLDLGCGVPDGKEHNERGGSFCDQYKSTGWHFVMGVDSEEWRGVSPPWEFRRGDLTDPVFMSSLPVGTFDLVNSRFFVSTRVQEVSPGLVLPSGLRPHFEFTDTTLLKDQEYLDFLKSFFQRVYECLKLGGLFAWNDRHLLVKEANSFQPYEDRWGFLHPLRNVFETIKPSARKL